jgi:hypothetical protein
LRVGDADFEVHEARTRNAGKGRVFQRFAPVGDHNCGTSVSECPAQAKDGPRVESECTQASVRRVQFDIGMQSSTARSKECQRAVLHRRVVQSVAQL